MIFRELLLSEFGPYGSLSVDQVDRLEGHYRLLLHWNQRLNLTRITDMAEVVRFHYCESLFLGTFLPPGPIKVGDFGSGAGFPGIPVAVLRPDVDIALLEADSRKAVFLREASRYLNNINVAATRFQHYRGEFNWIISRAVAPDEVFASKLASNFAVLMSPRSAPSGAEVIRLPWGRDRALVVSRGTVSRETSAQ